jgi:hypothetical protein
MVAPAAARSGKGAPGVARYTDSFATDRSLDESCAAVREVLRGVGWRLIDDKGWAFYAKEQRDLFAILTSNASKVAVMVRQPDPAERVRVEIVGATFGFGPIPRMRLRTVTGRLKQQIEHRLARLSQGAGRDASGTGGAGKS